MASKRLYDLSTATLTLAHKLIVDKTGLSEAEECLLSELITFLDTQNRYEGSFDSGDQGAAPNYDVTITHSLNETTPSSIMLYDKNLDYVDINGILILVDADNITFRMNYSVAGKHTVVIQR